MTTAPPEFDADKPTAELAEELHWQLFRIMSALRRQEYSRTAGGSLTLTQCSVLYFLQGRRRARMTDLAEAERVALPTMTKAVRRLRELGLVRRRRDASDHRNVWIEITPEGEAAQQEAVADLHQVMLTMLSPAEIAALHRSLEPLERLALGTSAVPTTSAFDY